MYIVNFFVDVFNEIFKRSPTTSSTTTTTTSTDEETSNEATPLRQSIFNYRRSLTSDFVDFSHSTIALKFFTMNLVIFLILSIIAYSYVFQDWPILISLYFAATVFTTVGFGDIAPDNNPSRIFTCFFAVYGIIILGLFLGIIGSLIIENRIAALEERKKKTRKAVIDSLTQREFVDESEDKNILKEIWNAMLLELPLILILGIFAVPIALEQGWDIVMSIYWMTITGTTIGFGDLDISQTVTRILVLLYLPIAVACFGEFLGRIAGIIVDYFDDIQEEQFLSRTMTLMDMDVMDTSKDGKVSEGEFLSYVLVALQKVDQEDIDEINNVFRRIDRNNSGFIEQRDLMAASTRMAASSRDVMGARRSVFSKI